MTFEALLQQNPDQLDTYTEEQLLEWFKPLLVITRPELAPKPEKLIRKEAIKREHNTKKDQALDILKGMGIKVNRW